MKLNSLHIKNFRMLEDFTVQKLGRVNLIVGGNNSGKSTVLEALRIYAGNAHPFLLQAIAKNRNESYQIANTQNMPFESFFTGHKFSSEDGIQIIIGDVGLVNVLSLEHFYGSFSIETKKDQNGNELRIENLRFFPKKDFLSPLFTLRNDTDFLQIKKGELPPYSIQLGLLYEKPEFMRSLLSFPVQLIEKHASYISTDIAKEDELSHLWEHVQLTEYEEFVLKALQLIDNKIQGLKFIEREDQKIAQVKLLNSPIVSLKSMGEGMSRILQLALKIPSAKNGFLLIDEFENGLHWSVQEKVWDMVFTMAEKLDIQVFATTHSYDCIKAFSKSATKAEDRDGVLFKMGYNKKLEKTVALEFSREELSNLSETMLSNATLEVR